MKVRELTQMDVRRSPNRQVVLDAIDRFLLRMQAEAAKQGVDVVRRKIAPPKSNAQLMRKAQRIAEDILSEPELKDIPPLGSKRHKERPN